MTSSTSAKQGKPQPLGKVLEEIRKGIFGGLAQQEANLSALVQELATVVALAEKIDEQQLAASQAFAREIGSQILSLGEACPFVVVQLARLLAEDLERWTLDSKAVSAQIRLLTEIPEAEKNLAAGFKSRAKLVRQVRREILSLAAEMDKLRPLLAANASASVDRRPKRVRHS
ncbi:Hypothetical protein UVM_LOCUS77 [uncultured virus]|nr:Hypothetical protein UVM_LOCUS77 [uncultured virus]